MLDRVTDDLAVDGPVDFSLRRAARAAGTTHKVLLCYFASANDLLVQAVLQLRDRRIEKGMAAAGQDGGEQKLSARVRAIWPILTRDEDQVLDQAIGLAMYDPIRRTTTIAKHERFPMCLALQLETMTKRKATWTNRNSTTMTTSTMTALHVARHEISV